MATDISELRVSVFEDEPYPTTPLHISVIGHERYQTPPRVTMNFSNDYLWLTDLDMNTPRIHNPKQASISVLDIAENQNNQNDQNNIHRFYQHKKYYLTQPFISQDLESEFNRYSQNYYIPLIYAYIVVYFIVNIVNFCFYDQQTSEDHITITYALLFVRIAIATFLLIFGFLFWWKLLNTVKKQRNSMILFNTFIASAELTISWLRQSTQYEIFIILIICIHLFSGIGYCAASIICVFIISTFIYLLLASHSTYYIDFAYLVFTAFFLFMLSIFIEFNSRRRFFQLQKLQFIKRKSKESLEMVLPPDAANWLRKGRRIAVAFKYQINHPQHKGVSVLFAQICNFDELVCCIPAKNLISVLNKIFTKWDDYASLHKLFKLKTINEIYIAAGGLPYPECNKNDYLHPIRMIFYANDLMYYNNDILKIYDEIKCKDIDIQISIGLNIGNVIAAVIGKKVPRYDIFGDTVNVASRMESTCKPSEIQMTDTFYNALPKSFDRFITKKENVEIKGKGKMTTYLLNHIDRTQHIELKEEDNNYYNANNIKRFTSVSSKKKPHSTEGDMGLFHILSDTKRFNFNDNNAKETESDVLLTRITNTRYT